MKVILFIFLIFFCLNENTQAQDSDPKDFFERNYANSKESDSSQTIKNSSPTIPIPQTPTTSSQKDNSIESRVREITDTVKNKLQNSTQNGIPTTSSKKVLGIGALINAEDKKHYFTVIGFLSKLIDTTYKLKIGSIYSIGNFKSLDPLDRIKFAKNGGRIIFRDSIPEKYKTITKSPTWILITEDSEILLEGILDPAQYISEDGYFVKEGVPPAPTTPTATSTPEIIRDQF